MGFGGRGGVAVAAGLSVVALAAAGVVGLDASGHLAGGLFADPSPTPSQTLPRGPVHTPAGPVLPTADPSVPGGPDRSVAAALDRAALQRLLADKDLGPDPGAVVLDGRTGEVLFERDADRPRTPASVAKLATSAAALVTLGPDARLATRVVAGTAPDEVVLVGGGDPTLRVAPQRAGAYPVEADLTTLAAATATALRGRGVDRVRLRVDDGLFEGPSVSPDWPASYVRSGVVAPVTALSVDEGRVRPGKRQRHADPALAAGNDFARLLAAQGVAVAPGIARASAPTAATELASVRSPTVSVLVERALATSDNDLAEALSRLAAHASGRPASFAGGQQTVAQVLGELGVPAAGLHLLDGSGLARGSVVAPTTLAHLLVAALGDDRPELRPLVTGLPVAAFSGTLDDRFDGRTTSPGAGVVRAKTGTLTGVSSLAGTAPDATGRLLVFAVLADRVPPAGTLGARDRLDRIAAALAAR